VISNPASPKRVVHVHRGAPLISFEPFALKLPGFCVLYIVDTEVPAMSATLVPLDLVS
jgi:hypothetical protein